MSECPVDLTHLGRYTGDDKTLNGEILRLFDDQATQMVNALRAILADRDHARWKEITRAIQSAARGVGAQAFGEAAAAAEPLDITHAQTRAEDALAALSHESLALRHWLATYLAA